MCVARDSSTPSIRAGVLTSIAVLKISQAVGVGFVVMGAIGFVIKLSEYLLAGRRPGRSLQSRSPHSRQQRSCVVGPIKSERRCNRGVEIKSSSMRIRHRADKRSKSLAKLAH